MNNTLLELLFRMEPDPWREQVGFSPEMAAAHERLFVPSFCEQDAIDVLNDWIYRNQPCLFGRMAAKCSFLSYCILTEKDLEQGDEAIRDKIQAARTGWTCEAFNGRKNGLIIAVVSPRVSIALPDESVKRFALRLAFLHLLEEIQPDQAFLDRIWLEKPGPAQATWEWDAGVNYFCAQGDKRWWQDHRIPGGMALSVNSVGHMVKSGILAKSMQALNDAMDTTEEDWSKVNLNSLEKALELAMRTIANASSAVSGPATQLADIPTDASGAPLVPCPTELPAALARKNYCEYLGHYHTDYTIPSEYFLPDVQRPEHLRKHVLDFTYLFHRDLENPDHERMGRGRRIRADEVMLAEGLRSKRLSRAVPKEVMISECSRLIDALETQSA